MFTPPQPRTSSSPAADTVLAAPFVQNPSMNFAAVGVATTDSEISASADANADDANANAHPSTPIGRSRNHYH